MGCLLSFFYSDAEKESKRIDSQLRRDHFEQRLVLKILLLGAGECGKSTVIKQMRIIYAKGFTDDEKKAFIKDVQKNALTGIVSILKGMINLDIEFENEDMKAKAIEVESFAQTIGQTETNNSQSLLLPEIVSNISDLWNDRNVQECFQRSNEYHLIDSAPYFLNSIERISKHNYVPSDLDIVNCRIQTTKIVEQEFLIRSKDSRTASTFKVIDVGGQRNFRKKWIHCFEEVTAVLFVAALSDYDLKLAEDSTTNRMKESLKLFDSICNLKWFEKTNMILFLNKKDSFMKKIQNHSLRVCFPEYTGQDNFKEACDYIKSQFEMKQVAKKRIYTHFTCATDTESLRFVLTAVTDIIIQKNLEEIGLA